MTVTILYWGMYLKITSRLYLERLIGGLELVDVVPEVPVPGVHPVHILLPAA
jgi:hypothetical protein